LLFLFHGGGLHCLQHYVLSEQHYMAVRDVFYPSSFAEFLHLLDDLPSESGAM
jgi:hypothetical protein